jgi:Tol biopolymer transport system component
LVVRNEAARDEGNGSPLSIVEIETGESKVLVPGGVDPSWSPLPGGPIAFTRASAGQKRNYGNEEVWVVDPDGSNLRRVGGGGFPTWTNDGRLVYRERIADGSVRLASLRIESTDDDLSDNPRETAPIQTGFPAVSRDGTLIAESLTGKLVIRKRDSTVPVCTVPLQSDERGLADFSPDGRYLAYGSWSDKYPGLLLMEVATGKSRVLAGVAATLPRWSPDGRFIAVDVRSQNKILILDVSTLDLAQCFEDAP